MITVKDYLDALEYADDPIEFIRHLYNRPDFSIRRCTDIIERSSWLVGDRPKVNWTDQNYMFTSDRLEFAVAQWIDLGDVKDLKDMIGVTVVPDDHHYGDGYKLDVMTLPAEYVIPWVLAMQREVDKIIETFPNIFSKVEASKEDNSSTFTKVYGKMSMVLTVCKESLTSIEKVMEWPLMFFLSVFSTIQAVQQERDKLYEEMRRKK